MISFGTDSLFRADDGVVYQMRCGLSLPSLSHDKSSRELIGGLLVGWQHRKTLVLKLVDYVEFSNIDFLDDYDFGLKGIRPRLYVEDSEDLYRSEFDRSRFKIYFGLPEQSDRKINKIFHEIEKNRLTFAEGGVCYKRFGLFLANPKDTRSSFVEALGELCNG